MNSGEPTSAVNFDGQALQQLDQIVKKPAIDIAFQDLKFSVRDGNKKEGCRQILNSINGKFRSGELTAILGPSGAGKTTLLNILTGYVEGHIQGSITINDHPRNRKIFKKLSAYITHDDIVQPHLTVKEALIYAASFKLGPHIKPKNKTTIVEEVINLLGLEKCVNTHSERLSGGERKRLAIALELVNNPPVIFLDEPTTGLDDFAVKQCMDFLRKISKLGRTVIFTIHQPSASLVQLFDQVYILADGYCVYNGSPSQMVPFLSSTSYSCPSNNTPTDYIIELVHLEPITIKNFTTAIDNGKINLKETNYEDDSGDSSLKNFEDKRFKRDFRTSFSVQFFLLLSRMFLQMKRNRVGLYIQFFHHLLSGIGIAAIFTGIGNNAEQSYAIIKYCTSCIVCFAYTYTMIPILLFPLEVRLIKKEYFNQWYSLKAYYCALAVSTLPLLIVLVTIFSSIAYFFTNQPLELDRFIGFCLMIMVIAYTSQGLGYMIGSIFDITKGSVVGSAVLILHIMIALHGIDYKATVEPFYVFLMSLTYVRNGLVGLCSTVFYEREPLACSEIYCHYTQPQTLLNDLSIPLINYKYELGFILISAAIFRIVGYLCLKFRLNSELSSRFLCSFKKN